MKIRNVIVIVITSSLLFGCAGYFVGILQNNRYKETYIDQQKDVKDYKEAYAQGWSYWFSSYGMNGEGAQYISYYQYGRKYKAEFQDNHDAFITGYNDAFFYINKSEPDEIFTREAEDGYKEYYPD